MANAFEVKRRSRQTARRRRMVVGVIGSRLRSDLLAEEMGRMIASTGCDLLTGAGPGVMEAVSRGFFNTTPREGIVIAIVPARVEGVEDAEGRPNSEAEYAPPPGYPNEWVELAIYTHLPDSGDRGMLMTSRNHVNVLTSDLIVALPGGRGTWSEMRLGVQYGIPVIAIGDHVSVPQGVIRAGTVGEIRVLLNQLFFEEGTPSGDQSAS
jgi:predicted Rossmann-fold nucleotide-binding protein